jgi:hypothetical protein
MEWIPHKTEAPLDPNYRSVGPIEEVKHVHPSAFSKPSLEHISFSVFDPLCMQKVAENYKRINLVL